MINYQIAARSDQGLTERDKVTCYAQYYDSDGKQIGSGYSSYYVGNAAFVTTSTMSDEARGYQYQSWDLCNNDQDLGSVEVVYHYEIDAEVDFSDGSPAVSTSAQSSDQTILYDPQLDEWFYQ